MILLLLAACTAPAPSGILVISLDTLRPDRLGAYGSTAGLTPNLDRFAAESIVFDNAYAQSNETLYSHTSLFTSQYPSQFGPLDRSFLMPPGAATLASSFRDAGWDTAGFVAGGHLSKGFGLNLGFTVYDDSANWGSLHDTAPKALRWLARKKSERPFLLFVHGYDTHDRYLKPTPFGYAFADPTQVGLGPDLARQVGGVSQIADGVYEESKDLLEQFSLDHPRFERGKGVRTLDPAVKPLTADDVAFLAKIYDGSVTWMDAWFGLFMAGLEQQGLLDRLTIVVLSDHGEELGENGVFHHRYGIDDKETHVPLMVRLPKGKGGGRHISGLCSLLNVTPTLLDLAGLRGLKAGVGHSLRSVLEGGTDTGETVVLSEGALRLTTARSAHARLTVEGFSTDNPLSAAAIAVAPVDGLTLSLTGDAAELPLLRDALVKLRRPP